MATLHVKNTSSIGKAFKVRGGFHVVAAGASEDVPNARPLTEEQIAALALEGLTIRLVDEGDKPAASTTRDDNGDTVEMAELRQQFGVSLSEAAGHLKAAHDKADQLAGELAKANSDKAEAMALLSAKDVEIEAMKAQIIALTAAPGPSPLDHDGKAGGSKPNDPPNERDELKKQAGELGIEYARNISTEKLKELIDAKLAA